MEFLIVISVMWLTAMIFMLAQQLEKIIWILGKWDRIAEKQRIDKADTGGGE